MTDYPDALLAHLANDVTTLCHCWRLTRRDGNVSGYTDHDRPLSMDGVVYEPEAGFSGSEARNTLGLGVDTVDVEGVVSSSRIRDEDVSAGLYDGAAVDIFLVNWAKPEDRALVRSATIGKITRSDQRFVAELESATHALDQPDGRYVRRTCDAELGDSRCGFDPSGAGFTGVGTVIANVAPYAIMASGLDAFELGWFADGALRWDSGANSGRVARVENHLGLPGAIQLDLVPSGLAMPQAGDAFTVTAGCDKKFETCKRKFNNMLNFRGFPHLPGNDAAYAYVTSGEQFDGGALVP